MDELADLAGAGEHRVAGDEADGRMEDEKDGADLFVSYVSG